MQVEVNIELKMLVIIEYIPGGESDIRQENQ